MQTNAPASNDFVDQFNRATTFRQVQVGGSNLTNPLVLPNGGAVTIPDVTGAALVALKLSTSITFGACAGNGAVTASAQTVTGAAVGDPVIVTCTTNRTTLTAGGTSNIVFDGVVTATNAVSVRAHNPHGNSITLPALDFDIIVLKGI
jgi:hypothetical protein